MNLLFFDIECAGVYKTAAKICAFGYVLCDENFNILEKEDILINPLGKFNLTSPHGDGLVLPYDESEFKNKPTFPRVFRRIKTMLEDKNNVVLGHATINDVRYLNLETRRFKLPSFNFSYSDSQLLFMSLKGDFSHQFGLESIAKALNVEFTPHRAADDAYATMRVVEAMCKEQGVGYFELAAKLKIKNGRICNYAVLSPTSGASRADGEKRRREKSLQAKVSAEFARYVGRKRPKKSGALFGKTYAFSHDIEQNLAVSEPLIDRIYELGGKYSRHVSHATSYVFREGDKSMRTQNAVCDERLEKIELSALKEQINA